MKIRTGFVSNSSSSSFVILGISRESGTDNDYDEQFQIDGKNYSIRELYIDEFENIIGYLISHGENCLDDKTIDFSLLEKMKTKLAEQLSVDESEIKLYTGTTPC